MRRYDNISIALHWAIAALALAQLALGWWMIGLPDKTGVQRDWFNLHKSVGLTIGTLMLVRLAWRLFHPAPALPASLPSVGVGFAAAQGVLWQRPSDARLHHHPRGRGSYRRGAMALRAA
jgi:cytochrome b561